MLPVNSLRGLMVAAIILMILPLRAFAQSSCSTSGGSPLTSSAIKELCELECRAEASSATHSPLAPKPEVCASADAEVKADLEQPVWKMIADCAVSAGFGQLNKIAELLAPADFRQFVNQCSRDTECKRKLARDIEQYRQRKPDGSFQISDQDLDAKIAGNNFVNDFFRSKHDVGSNMDLCQAQLGKITASLNNALSDSPTEADKQKILQSRYEALAKFDPDCPRYLHLVPPSQDHFQPDLNRVASNAAAKFQKFREGAKSTDMLAPIMDFYKEMKISYQCYDGATRRQLMCYAVGNFIDPTMLVGAGVGISIGTKALIKSGLARYEKQQIINAQQAVVHRAYNAVDVVRAQRQSLVEAGVDTSHLDAELAARKKLAGQAMVDFAFQKSALMMDEAKFRSLMNENAFARLEQSTQTKPMSISDKTVREGDNAGLVVDPNTKQPVAIDERYITADADVKKRMRRTRSGNVTWSERFGFESAESAASRKSENEAFHQIDRRHLERDLVNHGPLEDLPTSVDKFHKPLVIEDKYPITVYLPNGDIRLIHTKMEEDLLTRQLGAMGYR